MRNIVILCSLFVATSCSSPSTKPASSLVSAEQIRESQQKVNHKVWESHAEDLARQHAGEWTLIAQGKLIGSWPDFHRAWEAASALSVQVTHAYLFRAGQDDVETTIQLPPIQLEDPNWIHFGMASMERMGLLLSFPDNVWEANGKKVTWGEQDARLVLENPSRTLRHEVRAVTSTGFQGELTLRPIDAEALDLGRFTAPLPAYPEGGTQACKKVVLRVSVPELEAHFPIVAYVLPEYSNP